MSNAIARGGRTPDLLASRGADVRVRDVDADQRRVWQDVGEPEQERAGAAADVEHANGAIGRHVREHDIAHSIRPLRRRGAGLLGEAGCPCSHEVRLEARVLGIAALKRSASTRVGVLNENRSGRSPTYSRNRRYASSIPGSPLKRRSQCVSRTTTPRARATRSAHSNPHADDVIRRVAEKPQRCRRAAASPAVRRCSRRETAGSSRSRCSGVGNRPPEVGMLLSHRGTARRDRGAAAASAAATARDTRSRRSDRQRRARHPAGARPLGRVDERRGVAVIEPVHADFVAARRPLRRPARDRSRQAHGTT